MNFGILNLLLLIFITQISTRKLLFIQNVFRHGARYPVFLNNDDYTNEPKIANNVGQLTVQGKNMHYILGKALYKKYWSQLFNGTQSQTKYDHKQIYVRSTNVNRTIQSVQSQLRGWLQNLTPLTLKQQQRNYSLPAFDNIQNYVDLNYTNGTQWQVFNRIPNYQPIPIHVGPGSQSISSANPFDQGDFLIKFDAINCPNQNQWQQANLDSDMSHYIQNLPQVKQAMQKLAQSFPSVKMEFKNAYKYIDNYDTMKYLGEPTLPIFDDQKYMDILKYIKQVSLFLVLYNRDIQYYTTSSLLFQKTLSNIKVGISQKGPKIVLYSAHDTTIGMILATLNFTNVDCINKKYLSNIDNSQTCITDYPRFASNFIIEVYKEDNGVVMVEMVFNNIRRRMPFCDHKYTCQLSVFQKWVATWIVHNPNKACGIQDQFQIEYYQQKSSTLRLYAVVGMLSIIIAIMAIWIYHLKSKIIQQTKAKQGYMDNFQEKDPQKKQIQIQTK